MYLPGCGHRCIGTDTRPRTETRNFDSVVPGDCPQDFVIARQVALGERRHDATHGRQQNGRLQRSPESDGGTGPRVLEERRATGADDYVGPISFNLEATGGLQFTEMPEGLSGEHMKR